MKDEVDGNGTTAVIVRIIALDGTAAVELSAPASLPSDIVPGEIVQWPKTSGGLEIFVVTDKSRSWDNGVWAMYLTLAIVEVADIDDAAIAGTRRKLLQGRGWLA